LIIATKYTSTDQRYTDQYEISEIDDDDGRGDKQLTTEKDVFVQNHGQRERNCASKSAVRHHELTDTIQL